VNIETKNFSGNIIECKQENREGIPVGIVKGYIATWDIDSWSDQFQPGAFQESLSELRTKNKDLPLKKEHNDVIGKFPIMTVKEDERGLYGEAEVNLEVQEGREYYSLARQKAIADFSIGYVTVEKEFDSGIRKIFKAKVKEGSMVGNPMNEEANFTEVKSREDLPKQMVDIKHWFDESDIEDSRAFLFERKMQIADVIDGELKIIPRAVINARISMIKGVDGMTDEEMETARDTLNILYKEIGFNKPFSSGRSMPLNKTEIKSARKSALIDILRNTFSADASEFIASLISSNALEEEKSNDIGQRYDEMTANFKKLLEK
jgi:HK97 family phage prohead protease